MEEVKQTVSLNLSSLCSDLLTGQSDSCKDQPLLVLIKWANEVCSAGEACGWTMPVQGSARIMNCTG